MSLFGLTSLRFCCAAKMATASTAREPVAYHDYGFKGHPLIKETTRRVRISSESEKGVKKRDPVLIIGWDPLLGREDPSWGSTLKRF